MMMGIQLYVSERESPPRVRRIGNVAYLNKPKGGLWTSTFINETCGSEWVQWAIDNDFLEMPLYSWLIKPRTKNIYTIDSLQDLIDLQETYPNNDQVDWVAVSKNYDAVHLTKRGQKRTALSTPDLYGWDVESTVWFKQKFSARYIGAIEYRRC